MHAWDFLRTNSSITMMQLRQSYCNNNLFCRSAPLSSTRHHFSHVHDCFLSCNFFRHHQSYSILSLEWGISHTQISQEVHHILPILCTSMNEMPCTLPTAPQKYQFKGVIGAINCTALSPTGIGKITMPSYLEKIKYLVSYICDIFWSLLLCLAQIICELEGQIIVMHLGMVHNNDQGMFNLTMFKNGWEKMAFTCSQTVDTMIIG